jgi:deoxycytidine triphosphate deaminase
MSGLSDVDLRDAIKSGRIVFNGNDDAIQPASIDLQLGNELIRRRRNVLNRIAPRLFPLPPVELIVETNGRWSRVPRPTDYETILIPTFEDYQFQRMLHADMPLKLFGKPKPFTLYPGDFCLGSIKETIGPKALNLAGRFQDKSSCARLGLTGYGGSGWVDPSNVGRWTVELHNKGFEPVQLFAGMNIIQLCFEELISPASIGYQGKYLNPDRVEGAK